MSDLFHPDVPEGFIVQVATVMLAANWHTYQILTKRSLRLRDMLNGVLRFARSSAHIWWGVSVEDVRYGIPRISDLRDTGALIKFLSVEPLLEDLGFINLNDISWVIVGGESGPGARPMDESWVDSVHQQCEAASVPFFFKQWGGVQKKKHGRTLHGKTYDQFPKTPVAQIPERRLREELAERLEIRFKNEPCETRSASKAAT